MERTLVLVKPGAVARGLTGQILARFEARNLKIVQLRLMTISRDLAAEQYAEHSDKWFFERLVNIITASPVVAAVIEGPSAIAAVRAMAGATDPAEAAPGTIRGDYGIALTDNIVHASDSPESSAREIGLFFPNEC